MALSAATGRGPTSVFPTITTDYADDCRLKDIRFTVRVTSATGYGAPGLDNPEMEVGYCGVNSTSGGCSGTKTFEFVRPATATGNTIGGAACGNLVFDTAAPPPAWNRDAPPPAPYTGTFQWDPTRSGIGRDYRLRGLELHLGSFVSNHPADAVVECAHIVITTKIVP
jgi:hypothetical protein